MNLLDDDFEKMKKKGRHKIEEKFMSLVGAVRGPHSGFQQHGL